ncbi:MAG: Uma2 family endonuclease [Paraglaciecola sp.]|jgi:Uma2 family endonuclease
MTAIGAQQEGELKVYSQQVKISWEDFECEYLSREDEWKYEWINGYVEKTKRTMNQYQFFILNNLKDLFDELKIEGKISGYLGVEMDAYFLENIHRIPDVAYYSLAQNVKMAAGENQVPEFVIEIILKTDNINRVNRKVQNYREAKVAVIWHVFPELEEVHIYHDDKMVILKGTRICSAAPILSDFEITVNDVFKKPTV